MKRTHWTTLAIVVALLWATRFVVDAGPPSGSTDPLVEKEAGDRAFEAAAWWKAARHYRRAFALEDPRAKARIPHRAFLAQQAGVAYARVATAPPGEATEPERRNAQSLASMWLEQALYLDGTRGWVHYELAVAHDRLPDALRDPARARDAYAAFIRWVDDATAAGRGKPAADDPAVADARRRIEALAD